jgi:hypothetical protein
MREDTLSSAMKVEPSDGEEGRRSGKVGSILRRSKREETMASILALMYTNLYFLFFFSLDLVRIHYLMAIQMDGSILLRIYVNGWGLCALLGFLFDHGRR